MGSDIPDQVAKNIPCGDMGLESAVSSTVVNIKNRIRPNSMPNREARAVLCATSFGYRLGKKQGKVRFIGKRRHATLAGHVVDVLKFRLLVERQSLEAL